MLPIVVLALTSGLLAATTPSASVAETGCSSDVFAIDGSSVSLAICASDAPKTASKTVVTERFVVKNMPDLVRELALDRLPGADSARAIDDVSLEKLGISRTLHLTVALKGGTVHLEHALLIPGAVALK